MQVKTSIVIRAHNEADHIERLMLGIVAQSVPPHEVVLVDSGSTDDTAAIAASYGARVVEIKKEDFTFGRALNLGCQEADGDLCVFVSAHTYPIRETWLAELVAPFAEDRVALSYGRQRGDERSQFSEHQIFAQWFPPESVCPQPTHFCNNANCAIRRSVWTSQPYDESLTGLEDLAWAKAAREAGHWIAYVAEAEIAHVHDETWPMIQNRYRREAMAMRSIDDHAHFGLGALASILARNVLSDVRAAYRQGVLGAELVSILRFRYNQVSGTYRGFNGPSELSAQLRNRFYYPGENGWAPSPEGGGDAIDYSQLEASARHARLEEDSAP